MIRVLQKARIKKPKETLTKSPAITMNKKVMMWVKMSDIHRKTQRGCRIIQKNKAIKIWEQAPDVVEQKTFVKFKDESCSIMMGIPTKEWDDLPSPVLMSCQTSSQEFLQTYPITDKIKEAFLHNKGKSRVIRVVDTILDDASESEIDEKL